VWCKVLRRCSDSEANYIRTFYHNGVNWYETGFSPSSPLSTSATQNTKSTLPYQAGGFSFLVCCNKNGTNYGCQTQGIEVPLCPDTVVPNSSTVTCSYSGGSINFAWTWNGDNSCGSACEPAVGYCSAVRPSPPLLAGSIQIGYT